MKHYIKKNIKYLVAISLLFITALPVYAYSPIERLIIPFGNNLGIGTTTSFTTLQIASSTTSKTFKPQIVLTDNAAGTNAKHWFISSEHGTFNIGTTSDIYGTSTLYTIGTNGQFIKFAGISVGGISSIATSTDRIATTTPGPLVSYTPIATSTLRASCYVTITAIAVDVIKCQTTYTDETNTSRTQDFFPQGLTSQLLSSTGAFIFPTMDIRVKANTTATVQTILTTGAGSITYDAGSDLEIIR